MTTDAHNERTWRAPFFTIWTGQAFSLIGTAIARFALIWWLTDLTGSATVLAGSTLLSVIPRVILGPMAGVYIDRHKRRTVMILADAFTGLVSLWLAYQFWAGSMQVWHVYVVIFSRALGSTFHGPAMSASTSLMVPERHLARVAGINQTLEGILSFVGPALGALFLELLPLHSVMMIDVGTAVVAIGTLLVISIPEPVVEPGKDGERPSVWLDMREGFRYILGWRGMAIFLGMAMTLNFMINPAFSMMPLLVKQQFLGGAPELAVLESAHGIGLLVGGVALSVWGGFRKKTVTILTGTALLGVGIIILGLTPATAFWIAIAASVSIGFLLPFVNGTIGAMLQATTAPEMQGRVFTVTSSLASAMTIASLAVAGPVADAVGIRTLFVASGLVCLLEGIMGFFIPALMTIEEQAKEIKERRKRAVGIAS